MASSADQLPASERPTLARSIGLWSAMAVVIGSTIGSGIFRSPAGIADKLITLCQQASPTISGFSGVNVIATDRGAVTLDDGELRHTSRWRVQANQ